MEMFVFTVPILRMVCLTLRVRLCGARFQRAMFAIGTLKTCPTVCHFFGDFPADFCAEVPVVGAWKNPLPLAPLEPGTPVRFTPYTLP